MEACLYFAFSDTIEHNITNIFTVQKAAAKATHVWPSLFIQLPYERKNQSRQETTSCNEC